MHQPLVEARLARAQVVEVPLPSSLSATSARRGARRPRDAGARPGPADAAQAVTGGRFGTRFHAWVEARFGQQQLVGLDEVPGRGDAEIDDDTDLQHLVERFNAGAFAERTPYAIEPPFALVLGGQVVRGRIDAVYETERGFLVVDWKTNREQTADPLQLAIYRVAWAELQGVPVEQVEAAFYYVRTGDLVSTTTCPAATSSSASSPSLRGHSCGVEASLVARGSRAGPAAGSAPQRCASIASSATSTMCPKVCSRSCEVVSSPVRMWSETVQIVSRAA